MKGQTSIGSQFNQSAVMLSHDSKEQVSVEHKKSPRELFQQDIDNLLTGRHFDAVLTPKSQDHLQFLTNCTSFQGNLEFGKVHANLDPRLFSFLKSLDESKIIQCYTDAVLLSGEYSSSAADSRTLIEQSGISNDLTQEQLQNIVDDQANANHFLSQTYERKSHSCLPAKNLHSLKHKKQYSLATSGGNLKKDYALYCRAERFKTEILKVASHKHAQSRHEHLQKMMQQHKTDAVNMIIALSRLQRLYDNRAV